MGVRQKLSVRSTSMTMGSFLNLVLWSGLSIVPFFIFFFEIYVYIEDLLKTGHLSVIWVDSHSHSFKLAYGLKFQLKGILKFNISQCDVYISELAEVCVLAKISYFLETRNFTFDWYVRIWAFVSMVAMWGMLTYSKSVEVCLWLTILNLS